MQTLAYLLVTVALFAMSISAWAAAAVSLVLGIVVWAWDGPNRRSDS